MTDGASETYNLSPPANAIGGMGFQMPKKDLNYIRRATGRGFSGF